jgi:membrane associated rhomboid family serine protease
VVDTGVTPWRDMPLVVKALVGAMIVAWGLVQLAPDEIKLMLFVHFAVIPARFDAIGPYAFGAWYEALGPLLGHVFLHADWRQLGPMHVGMNALMLIVAGPLAARRLGDARFLILFFVSALGGSILSIMLSPGSIVPSVGASDAICGVFAAYFMAWAPNPSAAFKNPQVRSAIIGFLLINVVFAGFLSASGALPIAWEAHLGGFIAGAIAYPLLAPKRARESNLGPWDAA